MLTKNEAIIKYIRDSERFKNSYFWSPPQNAAGRRYEEKKNSWSYSDQELELSVIVNCSCHNYYVTRTARINGKKVTLRDVKKLIK